MASPPPKASRHRRKNRRRRRLRRRLFTAAAFFAALLGLSFGALRWLQSDAAEELARRLLVRHGSAFLDADLAIERVRIETLAPPQVQVLGLTLHSTDADTAGLPLARIAALELRLGRRADWRQRRVPVESLHVDRPALRVALRDGKPRDLAALIERLRRPRPPGARPFRVDLGSVQVDDAAVWTSAEPGGLGSELAGLDFGFRQDERGDGRGSLSAREVALRAGELALQGELRPGTFAVEHGILSLDGTTLELPQGRIDVAGIVELPAPPGSPEPRALGYSVHGRTDLDLRRLRDAWPKLPRIDGKASASMGLRKSGAGPMVATFHVQAQDIAVHVEKPRPRTFFGGSPSLIGRFEQGRVILSEESVVEWGGGAVRPHGWLEIGGEMPFEVDAGVDGLGLEEVLASVTVPHAWVAMQMDGVLHLQGQLKRFAARGSGRVAVRDLFVWDGPWDAEAGRSRNEMLHVPRALVETGLTLDGKHCLLEPATVTGNATRLRVRTDFLFKKPLGLVIDARGERLDAADIGRAVAGLFVDGVGPIEAHVEGPSNDLDIRGSLEFDDFVFRDWPFGRVGGDVHWHARRDLEFTGLRGRRGQTDFESDVRVLFADVRRGGTRERLEIEVEAWVPEGHGRAEDVLPIFFGDSVKVRGAAWGNVSLRGPPAALSGSGDVHGRELAWLWERFATLDLRAEVRDGVLSVTEAFARKPSGHALFARGSVAPGGAVAFEFRVPRMGLDELEPLRGGDLVGDFSGDAVLSGTLADVRVDAAMRVEGTEYRGSPLGAAQLAVRVEEHAMEARATLLDGAADGRAEMQLRGLWPYRFALAWKDVSLDPFLPKTVLAQTEPVHAGMGGGLSGSGTLRDAFHDVELKLDDIYLERGRHRIEARAGKPVVVRWSEGAFRFENVELSGPQGRTDLRVDGWVRPDGPLDVSAKGAVDIAFADLAYDVFDRAEALALLLDLRARGMSTSAVDVDGSLELRSAIIKTKFFPHAVEVESAIVGLHDRRLAVERFDGTLGGGRLRGVDGSYILLDRSGYRPREYGLRAECVDCRVQFPSFLPASTGNARLQFRGTAPDDLELSGSIEIAEMVLRDPINWQRSLLTLRARSTENLAPQDKPGLFRLNLAVSSGGGSVRIDNNLGDMHGTSRSFRVSGDTNRVLLGGVVQVDGGRFPYSGHDFVLEPGTARFREGSGWFPELDLRMWTDISNRDETYRITYAVTGPLDDPKLVPSSEPYLAEADINLLLLLGMTQEQLAQANLPEVLAAAGGAGAGAYGESVGTSVGQTATIGKQLLPDQFEIVPVYSDTTGATTVWAVGTKELIPDLLTGEAGVGVGGRGQAPDSVFRVQLRLARNVYLEGSWVRDDKASADYGNFGLDVQFQVDLD